MSNICYLSEVDISYFTFNDNVLEQMKTVFEEDFDSEVELTICYKEGEKFRVKNVTDVKVVKTKGGGHNLDYTCNLSKVYDAEYGVVKEEGSREVSVKTEDVVAIKLKYAKIGGVSEVRTINFGK